MFEEKFKSWWYKQIPLAGDTVPIWQMMPTDFLAANQISFIAGYKQAMKDMKEEQDKNNIYHD